MNPNTIHLLEKNHDKINWCSLSENPNTIHLLEKNHDKIDSFGLSHNPNAIHLLEKNNEKIHLFLNWIMMHLKKRCNVYKEELMKKTLHPSIIKRYLNYLDYILDNCI